MAIASIEFFSGCLMRNVSCKVIMPTDTNTENNPHFQRPMKTLVLLHGYCCNNSDWVWNSQIIDVALRYNLCVIMPSAENSFYLDGKETGRAYATFIGEELLNFMHRTFGISDKQEDTYIGGFSMGGFGSIYLGLRFNNTFRKLFALSSALIQHEVMGMMPGSHNGMANYEYYKLNFGEPSELENSINNPEFLAKEIVRKGEYMPGIYMACGTEDFLRSVNQDFDRFLTEQKIPHEYLESPGEHNYGFWNQYLEPAVKWLLEE